MRCECKEETLIIKKRKVHKHGEGKPLTYPNSAEMTSKTFHIKYEQNLSSIAKILLNSFKNKYLYYAVDDILYSLKGNSFERDRLLAILYSPVLSLQNSLSINFFDIWIHEIYISEVAKVNKFLTDKHTNLETFNYITIKLMYETKPVVKKQDSLW